MRRILVALDGSPESEQILSEVDRVGARNSAIDLLHVLSPDAHEVPNAGVDVEDVAADYLSRVASRLSDRQVRTFIWRGEPEQEIPKAARSLNADLIAMTTHARKGLSHLLLGSVAEAVVRESSTPVLLTRPGMAPRPAKSLERILVPVDGTSRSREVLRSVRGIVADTGAEVILLQVVVPVIPVDPVTGFTPIGVPEPPPDPLPPLQAWAEQLGHDGIAARAVVTMGAAADRILEQAKSLNVDLIAMATAGHKGLARFMMGSVTEEVVRHMDRPVMLHHIAPMEEAESRVRELHAQGAD